MNPVKIKFATSTFLLIFFYFPKTLNGFVDTCSAKNTCTRYQDKLSQKINEPQFLERETRMVNVRDRVGSERLVNNRRIVDSDSRISENLDFPRLAQRSSSRNIRESRQCDRITAKAMRDSRVRTAPREMLIRESNERISTRRQQDYAIRASRSRRENRLVQRDSNIRDTRQIRMETRSTDGTRNIPENRMKNENVIRNVVIRSTEQRRLQKLTPNVRASQNQVVRGPRNNQNQEVRNAVTRTEGRVSQLDANRIEMSLNTRRTRLSEIRDARDRIAPNSRPAVTQRLVRESRERAVQYLRSTQNERREMSADSRDVRRTVERESREKAVVRQSRSTETRNDRRQVERDSRERAVRNARSAETRNDRRMQELDSRERGMPNESRNDRRIHERDTRERSALNSRLTETRNDRRMQERDSRERGVPTESRNDRRMHERDSRERSVPNSRLTETRNDRRMLERDSSERRLTNAKRREIRNLENQRTNHRVSNVERKASSGSAVDFNNNRRTTSSDRSNGDSDRRPAQRDSRIGAKTRISSDPNNDKVYYTKSAENEVFNWSNLLTTTFGVLLLTQILASSNSKKYGIPHISSFLNGMKEKIY